MNSNVMITALQGLVSSLVLFSYEKYVYSADIIAFCANISNCKSNFMQWQ